MKTLLALAVLILGSLASAQDGDWIVRRTVWSAQDEANYSAFIQALGRSKCSTVQNCIQDAANPYRDTDPEGARFYSDCADFPYFLRAYFAWKNELPFGYVSQVRTWDAASTDGRGTDVRYSQQGNYPTSRYNLVPRAGRTLDFFSENRRLQNIISSAMYRFPADQEQAVPSDFYSPEIRRGSIRAGTMIYDPTGHVAIVYDVLPDGRVLHFDAHPDNSVTRGLYSSKFTRSRPQQGAGFKNFRPLRLSGARNVGYGEDEFEGGTLVYSRNAEIPDYSLTQYYGAQPNRADWKHGTFVKNGKNLVFQEYVRATLATEKINPVAELEGGLHELCDALSERSRSIDAALQHGIHLKDHPDTLPANLFGAAGEWEDYATPGRDTRLRSTFVELKKNAEDRYRQWFAGDVSDMHYTGSDLKKDYLRAFHQVNLNCEVAYTNSVNRKVQLGFEIAIQRLFQLSFDPYSCPEHRWGATHPQELRTCRDGTDKTRWYNAEQGVRNGLQRDWSAPHPIRVDELEVGLYGSGSTPVIDLRAFFEGLPNKGGTP